VRLRLALLALSLGCQTAAREGARRDGGQAERQTEARPEVKDVTAEHYRALPLPRGRVLLRDAYGGMHRVEVEVAADAPSRQRGLMWRRALGPGTGMLFIFPEPAVQSFWMRNTLIPLDMLFIDDAPKVVGIIRHAEPHTLSPRTVGLPSRYVLEVPAGWTEQQGIAVGARVQLEGLGQVEVE
jgi:uncharacterized membrane protein (UPF0127 family)